MKLGFGLMRLPRLPEGGGIDVEQVKVMVDRFIEGGGTYFDTAYVYEGSEAAAREALVSRHPRQSYTLASKLNARVAKTAQAARDQFATSLERTGAGYFDYYLLHALSDDNYRRYEELGAWSFAIAQRDAGKIRHLGFSFHGTPELLDRLLDEHPEAEFVQLQINYADWNSPRVQSRRCYEAARRHNRPVTIMEPVKGGTLADPPGFVRDILTAGDPSLSPAGWALRFAASLDGVLSVLSGMSNVAQVEDNLRSMRDFTSLSESERDVLRRAQDALDAVPSIPCTGCSYCTEGCPKQIPIPEIFSAMNRSLIFGRLEDAKRGYANATRNAGKASECLQCGQCEAACPQHLGIIEYLKQCSAALE